MAAQKTYIRPGVHAMTGAVMDVELFRPEFKQESWTFGTKPIDAPLVLPLGGVGVLCESDDSVHAIDFVSARSS